MKNELKIIIEDFERIYGDAMRSNDISREESIILQEIRTKWDELMKKYLQRLEAVDKGIKSDFDRLRNELDKRFKEFSR